MLRVRSVLPPALRRSRRARRVTVASGTALLTVALSSVLAVRAMGADLTAPVAAQAATVICDKFGSTRTTGGYIAQNNLWGADTAQCITVEGDGFDLTTSRADKATDGAPASYPSLVWGCHYGNCTRGFTPVQASSSAFDRLSTSVRLTPAPGTYDAAYDLWFDPTPRTDGQNTGAEVMVWLDRSGPIQPIGAKVGTVELAGATWDVWFGSIGWNVVSYVRTERATSISFAVSTFYRDAVRRGYAQDSWYLTSVQAGIEPWKGGAGLGVHDFSVTSGAAQAPPPAAPRPQAPAPAPVATTSAPAPVATTSAPAPVATTSAPAPAPPARAAGCRVTMHRDVWPGGFVTRLEVTNTGPRTVEDWTVRVDLAAGQRVTGGWNATWAQQGRQAVGRASAHNRTLAPGGTASLGVLGSWTTIDAEPRAVSLDGARCSRT